MRTYFLAAAFAIQSLLLLQDASAFAPSQGLFLKSSTFGRISPTFLSSSVPVRSVSNPTVQQFMSPKTDNLIHQRHSGLTPESSFGLTYARTLRRGSMGGLRMSAVEAQGAPQAKGGRGALKCRAIGIGGASPARVISNKDMESIVDTTENWITTRTGIERRHVLGGPNAGGEVLRDLAVRASKNALAQAGIQPQDVDLVILATSSPDDLFGDAPSVAAAIGASRAFAFDLTAACSGFLAASVTAAQFLHSGAAKRAIVIGADALSRWVDWGDRNTCVLFGDGAGAMVLEATQDESASGFLGFEIHSDGAGYCHLKLPFAGETRSLGSKGQSITTGSYSPITMAGKEVYKFATREVPRVLEEALANAGVKVDQVDWLLLHQANIRIMEVVAERLGIPMDKVLHNLEEYGNTSAASIPLALAEAVASGKVKKGDVIACAGFGAGLTWGATVFRWG